MDRAPIDNGAICVTDGRIVDVMTASEAVRQYPLVENIDLGDVIVLPGLVNAHAHLELSDLTTGEPPPSLADWIISLIRRMPPRDAESVASAVRIGVSQSLRFGVTTVGDITAFPNFTRPALSAGPLRVVSFGEVRAMASRRGLLEQRVKEAADPSLKSASLSVGISPHSPYSIEMDGYRRCVEAARARGLPIATHLSEAPDEAAFLASHGGSLRTIWEFLNAWDDHVPTFEGSPIRFAQTVGLLNHHPASVLAHVNYCDDEELAILSRGGASVVYCPRTHDFFNHPPHRWKEMLANGINVAVGTDSCATSPDLNLVDDLRLLRRIAPDVPAQTLWEMATTRAAAALGLSDECGTLGPGKRADFITFALTPESKPDPLDGVLEHISPVDSVWICGERVWNRS